MRYGVDNGCRAKIRKSVLAQVDGGYHRCAVYLGTPLLGLGFPSLGMKATKPKKQEIVLDSVTSEATVSSIGSRLRLRTYGADAPVKFVNGLFGWV